MNIDLHTRSLLSGGWDSPAELVRKAAAAGISALALCDVMTVSGLQEARETAEELGVELICAVEVPAVLPRYETEVRLIGYFIDPESSALRELFTWAEDAIPSLGKAASALREAGGLVALADPRSCGITGMALDGFMQSVRCCGVEFIEAYYTGYSYEDSDFWLGVAKEWSMDPVGGSGYGDPAVPAVLGELQLSASMLDWMKECRLS